LARLSTSLATSIETITLGNQHVMVFKPSEWLPEQIKTDSIPISEFVLNEKYGRRLLADSRDPYTCGISGKSYNVAQVRSLRDNLAKALSKELGWEVNVGNEYDKVAAIYCFNTVSFSNGTGRQYPRPKTKI
jgi:hypothetical protein